MHHALGYAELSCDVVQTHVVNAMEIECLPAFRRQLFEGARNELEFLAGCDFLLGCRKCRIPQGPGDGLTDAFAGLGPADPIDRDIGRGFEKVGAEVADGASGVELQHPYVRLVCHVLRFLLRVHPGHQESDKRLIVLGIKALHQRLVRFLLYDSRAAGFGVGGWGNLLRVGGHGFIETNNAVKSEVAQNGLAGAQSSITSVACKLLKLPCDREDVGAVAGLNGIGFVAIARVRVLRVTPTSQSLDRPPREPTLLTTRTPHAKSTSEH